MKIFLITLTMTFTLGLAAFWTWESSAHARFSFLNREYPLFVGKFDLMDHYSEPGLVIFGDSASLAGILPERFNNSIINFSLGGTSPIENYFFVRRLLRGKVMPKAVLLSFLPYHFGRAECFWERGVKFGLIDGAGVNQVFNEAVRLHDHQFLYDQGPWGISGRLMGWLYSIGFPPYYVSSIIQAHLNGREQENSGALEYVLAHRGQFYMGQDHGWKGLNEGANFKSFDISPVIDDYFLKTLSLLEEKNIPVYFIAMPVNEFTDRAILPGVKKGYTDYLRALARKDPRFHILSDKQPIYSWRYFGDGAHLNSVGANRFSGELIKILRKERVPGGPYGKQ